MRYLERLHIATGTQHLPQCDEALLTPLRCGLPIARIAPRTTAQLSGLAARHIALRRAKAAEKCNRTASKAPRRSRYMTAARLGALRIPKKPWVPRAR